MFYVTRQGRGGVTLFLIDRSISKKHWWTTTLDKAMEFHKKSAAQTQTNKLKYGHPDIVEYAEAIRLERNNEEIEILNEIHPFSSEALGQD